MTPQDIFYIVSSLSMIIGLGIGIGLFIKVVKLIDSLNTLILQLTFTVEHIGEQKSAITPILLPLVLSVIKKLIPERR